MGAEPREDSARATRRRWPGWSRSVWHRIWWWAGFVVLAPLAVDLFRAPPQWPELLIGPVVVTLWRVIVAVYAIGAACWLLSLGALWPYRWLHSPSVMPWSTGWGGVLRSVVAGLVTAATLLLATGTAAVSLFVAIADHYYVLFPASAGGCRVVSRVNTGGIKGISGDVLFALPGSPVLRNTGGNWSTRGYVDPFRTGDWSLGWDGPNAVLTVRVGDSLNWVFDPHSQPSAPITCPR